MKEVIRDLLTRHPEISAGQVAAEAGVTRQAAHYHLAHLTAAGEVSRTGGGRGTRYRMNSIFARSFPLDELAEDVVWRLVLLRLEDVVELQPNVRSILAYAFTEMLNNAIDHSRGSTADVRAWFEADSLSFEVSDDGVGAFRTVRERFGLRDDFEAVQELSKGKRSTAPEAHSGQGIFFTSKAVDVFRLECNGIRWIVDNLRRDQAAGQATRLGNGTTVRWTLQRDTKRVLKGVFDEYSDPETLRFTKGITTIGLFKTGPSFISRSEAKRVAEGLERFDEVRLDFSGVGEVGQGFVDELFRVWAAAHPTTKLVPLNMAPAVGDMIRRGLPTP